MAIKIHPGCFVKKRFVGKCRKGWCKRPNAKVGERMWVIVEKIVGKTIYGKLDNIPVGIVGMRLGQKVRVRESEIIDVMCPKRKK